MSSNSLKMINNYTESLSCSINYTRNITFEARISLMYNERALLYLYRVFKDKCLERKDKQCLKGKLVCSPYKGVVIQKINNYASNQP